MGDDKKQKIKTLHKSSANVASVGKAFKILELFDKRNKSLTLTQVASEAQMDLSTAQRFLNTLIALGYVHKNSALRLYSLTPRILELGYHYIQSNELIERSAPHLQRLATEITETVNLGVLDGEDVILVFRIASPYVVRPEITVGARLPAFLTSSGYAILSDTADDQLREHIAQSRLADVLKPETIITHCKNVKARGYSLIADGYFSNDLTIAAPVFNADGKPYAALSIAVSGLRWKIEDVEQQLAPQLLECARAISITQPFKFAY